MDLKGQKAKIKRQKMEPPDRRFLVAKKFILR